MFKMSLQGTRKKLRAIDEKKTRVIITQKCRTLIIAIQPIRSRVKKDEIVFHMEILNIDLIYLILLWRRDKYVADTD